MTAGRYAALAITMILAVAHLACDGGGGSPVSDKRESYFEIVRVLPAPAKGLADITYARGNLWVADETGAGAIYKLDAATGSVVSSVSTTYGPPAGICSDGAYLYVVARDTADVWRHGFDSRLPELASYPTGLADVRGVFFDTDAFYLFDQGTAAVYEFGPDWNLRREWRVGDGTEMLRGLTLADGRVWSADWRNGWLIRHRIGSFDIDRRFCTYGQHPAGLAWDGTYLYVGDTAKKKIYKLDISTAP